MTTPPPPPPPSTPDEPPTGGAPLPPPPATASAAPEMPPAPPTRPRSGGRGRWLGLGVVGVGVIALIVVGVTFLTGGDSAGASSPQGAIDELVETVDRVDVLAMPTKLAPSETRGIGELTEVFFDRISELVPFIETYTGEEFDADRFSPTANLEEMGLGEHLNLDELPDLSVVDYEVIEEYETVALVEFSIDAEFDGFSEIEELNDEDLAELNDSVDEAIDAVEGERIQLVTVKEDGGWYISASLSIAHAMIEYGDADFTEDLAAIDELPDATAQSPEEAMTGLVDAFYEQDAEALISHVDLAPARVLVAYPDILDEAFGAEFDVDEPVRIEELELSETGRDSEYQIDRLVMTGGGETLTLDGLCATVPDEETQCLDEQLPWSTGIEGAPVIIDQARGGYVVALGHSMLNAFRAVVDDVDIHAAARLSEFAVYDAAVAATVGEQVTVDFDGKPYAVVEVSDVDPEQGFNLEFDGNPLDWDPYGQHGVAWVNLRHSYDLDELPETIRAVVLAPLVDPDCVEICEWQTDGSATFTIVNE